jgi:hypothetical protein
MNFFCLFLLKNWLPYIKTFFSSVYSVYSVYRHTFYLDLKSKLTGWMQDFLLWRNLFSRKKKKSGMSFLLRWSILIWHSIQTIKKVIRPGPPTFSFGIPVPVTFRLSLLQIIEFYLMWYGWTTMKEMQEEAVDDFFFGGSSLHSFFWKYTILIQSII